MSSRRALLVGLSVAVLALLGAVAFGLARAGQHPATAASPCAAPHDPCTKALDDFLQKPVSPTWTRQDSRMGSVYVALLPELGAFAVDASGQHVILAAFDVPGDGSDPGLNIDQAQPIALAYAKQHFPAGSVDKLQLRQRVLLNHGTFHEFSFTWQARQGEAWLPTYVHVGVSPSDAILGFSCSASPLVIGTQPSTPASSAESIARTTLAMPATMSVTSTELEVVVSTGGKQQLVWHVIFEGVLDASPTRVDAMVDARSGHLVNT